MATLYFVDTKEEVEVPDGQRIQEYCEEVGVPFACTEGVCGTCVIQVTAGQENLCTPTQQEVDFLGEPGEERLACQCTIEKGTVKVKY